MRKITGYSLKIRLASGFVLLAGAAILVFFSARFGGASPSEMAPTRFVQTPGAVADLRFSSDGRLLMTTEGEEAQTQITFRDAVTGSIVHQWSGGQGDKWLSDDGRRVVEAVSSEHGPTVCTLRDAVSGRIVRQWAGQVLDVRPDFTLMVTADDLRELSAPPGTPPSRLQYVLPKVGLVVDVATGRILSRFPLVGDSGYWLRLSRSAPFLCLPGEGKPARLLRLPQMTPALTGMPPLRSLRVSRDGTRAFGITDAGTLHLWLLSSGRHTSVATGFYQADWVSELPNGSLIVQGTEGSNQAPHNVVQVRTSDGTRLLRELQGYAEAFSPDGKLIAFRVGDRASGNGVEIWDCETGLRVARLDANSDALGKSGSRYYPGNGAIAIAPDGRHFALSTSDGLLRLYDVTQTAPPPAPFVSADSGRVILSFNGNQYEPTLFDAVVLSDGGVAASGGQDQTSDERRVQIWRPGGSVQTVRAVVGNGNVERLGVSPDGKTLAGSSQWGLWTMNLAGGGVKTSEQTFAGETVGQPVWLDRPGKPPAIVSNSDFGEGPVLLTRWDVTGRRLSEKTLIPQERKVGTQVFNMAGAEPSPDGKTLAVLWNGTEEHMENGKLTDFVDTDGMLELRDTRTGQLLRTLASSHGNGYARPSHGALDRPIFSPDGTRLAAADDTGIIQVWDTVTGRKLGQVSGTRVEGNGATMAFAEPMSGRGATVAFTSDNQQIAVSRDDGSLYLYLYSLHSWLPIAQIGQPAVRVVNGYPQPNQPLCWLAFSPDGKTLYGFARFGTDVLAWDIPKDTR